MTRVSERNDDLWSGATTDHRLDGLRNTSWRLLDGAAVVGYAHLQQTFTSHAGGRIFRRRWTRPVEGVLQHAVVGDDVEDAIIEGDGLTGSIDLWRREQVETSGRFWDAVLLAGEEAHAVRHQLVEPEERTRPWWHPW